MNFIPTDLSERNYTYENWKKMGVALARIRATAEKGAIAAPEGPAKEILTMIEKLEKDTGIKFGG
jgi:hypothetical protein